MTSGYRVYRHNGWYHVYHNSCNSSPDGLGQWMIAEIPKHPQQYERWLENTRRKLDQSFKTMSKNSPRNGDTCGDKSFHYYITRIQPVKSARIQWIWEIDCDNEVMHVDSKPFFRLSDVPRGDVFLSSITLDNYGHIRCDPNIPLHHQYTWRVAPPVPCPALLEKYDNIRPSSKVLSLRSLLYLPDHPGICEQARCSLYQTMIGAAVRTYQVAHGIPLLEQANDSNAIPDALVKLGRAMLHIALEPMIFCKYEYHLSQPVTSSQERTQWLRPDVCVYYTTHLDDPDTLKTCVTYLTSIVEKRRQRPSVTYAIALSFTHISISRITTSTGSLRVTHTPALEFLPSFFATTPSTPGIAAIIALSMVLDNSHILPRRQYQPSRRALDLPVELWRQIASHLTSCSNLKKLATLSSNSRVAVLEALRYPHIAGHRLLRALPTEADRAWVTPRWCRAIQEDYLPQDGSQMLYSQRFAVSCDDNSDLTLQVAPGDPPLRSLTRSWCERASSKAGLVKEGQFDLIPIANDDRKCAWTIKYGIAPILAKPRL